MDAIPFNKQIRSLNPLYMEKQTQMKKPLIIYHASCADGFGAAFAAWMHFGNNAEYQPAKYGSAFNEFDIFDRDVYVLDFSFSREQTELIIENCNRFVWLDHHKTAFEMWCPDNTLLNHRVEGESGSVIHLCNDKSGALLSWEYFHPDKIVPNLIKHIDDYDRWQYKIAGTKEFNKALWSHTPWTFEQWGTILLADHTGYPMMKNEGAAILRAHNQNVAATVKQAAPCRLRMPNVLEGRIVNCSPNLTSDVGHALATKNGTYGLMWYMRPDGVINCSLRSNGDYDVSQIASTFGGGGHKNAAGFETNIINLMSWMV